jgi:hypothetical protein
MFGGLSSPILQPRKSEKPNMVGGNTKTTGNTTLPWDYGVFLGRDRRRKLFPGDL